jgi:DNA-binding beta-propeller fold protein YncE
LTSRPAGVEAGAPADSTFIAVSPDGSEVFAAGQPLAAYNPATGATLWTAGNGTFTVLCCALAVSPDGSRLFATGSTAEANGTVEYATAAYDTVTGAQLWLATYHGPGVGGDYARSVAVSPDGSKVFVTGSSSNTTTGTLDNAYATVAYDAATGDQLWVARYSDGNRNAEASAVAVSPDGTRVYVTGGSLGPVNYQFATLAYNAATGATVWTERYSHGKGAADGQSVVVSPNGSRLYVGGTAHGRGGQNITTVAYTASGGTLLWARPYLGFGGDVAESMAISGDGSELVVTGQGRNSSGHYTYVTVASRAATGARLWVRHYGGPFGFGLAQSVAISPDGSKVLVTGFVAGASPPSGATDWGTVAYRATTGAQLWARLYTPEQGTNYARGIVLSPDGSRAFVNGIQQPGQYETVAYKVATGARLWAASP